MLLPACSSSGLVERSDAGSSPSNGDAAAASDATADANEAADGNETDADGGALPSVPPLNHRAVATTCTGTPTPTSALALNYCLGDLPMGVYDGGKNVAGGVLCLSDQDCTQGSNGRCSCVYGGTSYTFGTACSYDECTADSDCGKNVCICRDTVVPGVPADPSRNTLCTGVGNCQLDADCGAGGFCSPSASFDCGAGVVAYYGYYCHTPGDECVNDSDCAPQGNDANAFCTYDPHNQHWVCTSALCRDG
jgi:hypothetical protein